LAWPFLEHSECYGNREVTKLSNKTQSWAFDLSNEVTGVGSELLQGIFLT